MRPDSLAQKRSKFKNNCTCGLTQSLFCQNRSKTVKEICLGMGKWNFKMADQRKIVWNETIPRLKQAVVWTSKPSMLTSEPYVIVWTPCQRLSFMSRSGLFHQHLSLSLCRCLGFQMLTSESLTLTSEWHWGLMRTACHMPKPHLMWLVYGANYRMVSVT